MLTSEWAKGIKLASFALALGTAALHVHLAVRLSVLGCRTRGDLDPCGYSAALVGEASSMGLYAQPRTQIPTFYLTLASAFLAVILPSTATAQLRPALGTHLGAQVSGHQVRRAAGST